MATKKDLVEAYSFSRRRLVTAFVSGAPGGREVEPARPGRSIVGGLALGVLLIAGAAIAGVFTSSVDPAWAEQSGLIISKEEAEVFVITGASSDPVLHPILNITSAKLILGSDVEPQVIPEEYIAKETIGSDLGIFGAPYDVPERRPPHRERLDGLHRRASRAGCGSTCRPGAPTIRCRRRRHAGHRRR